jgi:hypothetical protein
LNERTGVADNLGFHSKFAGRVGEGVDQIAVLSPVMCEEVSVSRKPVPQMYPGERRASPQWQTDLVASLRT